MMFLPTYTNHLPTEAQINRWSHRIPGPNQRKARKARRARFAAGDRHAFRTC